MVSVEEMLFVVGVDGIGVFDVGGGGGVVTAAATTARLCGRGGGWYSDEK